MQTATSPVVEFRVPALASSATLSPRTISGVAALLDGTAASTRAGAVRIDVRTSRRELVRDVLALLDGPASVEIQGDLARQESVETWWRVIRDGDVEFESIGVHGQALRFVANRPDAYMSQVLGDAPTCMVYVGPEMAVPLRPSPDRRNRDADQERVAWELAGLMPIFRCKPEDGLAGVEAAARAFHARHPRAIVEVAWRVRGDRWSAPASSLLEALLAPAGEQARPWPPFLADGRRFTVTGSVPTGLRAAALLGLPGLVDALLDEPGAGLEVVATGVELGTGRDQRSRVPGRLSASLQRAELSFTTWRPERPVSRRRLRDAARQLARTLDQPVERRHGRPDSPSDAA